MSRHKDSGLVLFNVLALTAFMALIVMSMITVSDIALARSQRYSEATQAQRLVLAAEASAVSALQADMTSDKANKSFIDSPDEPWAGISQDTVTISGGTLAITIADLQGKLNLTNFLGLDPDQSQPDIRPLRALLRLADLEPDLADDLVFWAKEKPRVHSLAEIMDRMALQQADRARLSELIVLLPEQTIINANSAPVPVLTAILNDPSKARLIDSTRRRNGKVTNDDLGALLVQSTQLGLSSRFFQITATARIGETSLSLQSLIYRDNDHETVRILERN